MANTNPQIAKPRFLSDDAIFRAARRSTVQSAHLEERDVPEQFHRTTASEEYLTSRVTHSDGLDQHPPLSGSSLRETPQRFGMSPGYGATALPFDELDALLPAARASLDEPVMRADVYDLEQELEVAITEDLFTQIDSSELQLRDVLSDHFLRHLHGSLYESLWAWAGAIRRHDVSIGVDPAQIAPELRASLDNMAWRFQNTDDWSPRELGIAAHADCVRIHPFTDGNGRSTRLFADLVFLAAQMRAVADRDEAVLATEDAVSHKDFARTDSAGHPRLYLYDWNVEKRKYIDLLREYDQHRDPKDLAVFIGVVPI